jgi:hypothetical protein
MKTILTSIFTILATVSIQAETFKHNDLFRNVVTNEKQNITYTVEKLTKNQLQAINTKKLAKYVNNSNDNIRVAFDSQFVEKQASVAFCYSLLSNYKYPAYYFPKTYNYYIEKLAKYKPIHAEIFKKYKDIKLTKKIYDSISFQEFLNLYHEINDSAQLQQWKKIFVSKVIVQVKINLRSQGKSFVIKTQKDESGRIVKINPMKEYIDRITTILNAGCLVGINEFLTEIGYTEKFDTSKFKSDEYIEQLKNDILIGTKSIQSKYYMSILEK